MPNSLLNHNPHKETNFWDDCVKNIKNEVSDSAQSWLSQIELVEQKKNKFILGLPNNFVLNYVQKYFHTTIQEGIEKEFESSIEILYVNLDKNCIALEHSTDTLPKETLQKKQSKSRIKIRSILPLLPNYTFENFIEGEHSQVARTACTTVCQMPGQDDFNPLIIYGETGLGKTHLLQAMCFLFKKLETAQEIVYRTSSQLLQEFLEYCQKRESKFSFVEQYLKTDVILIDDIQFLDNKPGLQEEFFKLFSQLKHAGKQIVISSDRLPAQIKNLDRQLLSRFENGLTVDITLPERENRFQILKYKNKSLANNFITDEILDYIAQTVTTNVRELEGSLITIASYANLMGIFITLDMAKEILGDIHSKSRKISVDSIIEFIARYYNLSVYQITGLSRKQEFVTPRQIAMYISRHITQHSFQTIACSFKRNYCTVSHSVEKIQQIMDSDKEFLNHVNNLKDNIYRNSN